MLPHYFFHTGSSERPYSVWNHLQKLGNLCQKWHSLQPLSLATCTEFLNSLCCFGGGQGSSVFFQQSPLSAGSRALPWRPSGKNRSSDSVDTRQTSTGSRVASFGHQGSALLPSRGRSLPRLPPYPFSLRCPGPGADLPGCHLHRPGRRPVSPEQALRRVQLGKRASRGLCRGRARAREPGPRPRRLRGGRPPHPHRCPASTAWRLESLSDGATCPPRRPPQPRCEAAEVWGRSRGAGAGPGLPGRRGWGEPAPRGGRGRRKGCVSSWARGGGAAGGGGGAGGEEGGCSSRGPPPVPVPPTRPFAARQADSRRSALDCSCLARSWRPPGWRRGQASSAERRGGFWGTITERGARDRRGRPARRTMYAFVRFLEDNVCYALPVSCVQDFSPTSQLDFDNQKVYTVYRNPEEAAAEEDDESPGEWGDRLLLHKAQILALAGEGGPGPGPGRGGGRWGGAGRGKPQMPPPPRWGGGGRGRGGGGIAPTHAQSPGGTWRAGGALRREDGGRVGLGWAGLGVGWASLLTPSHPLPGHRGAWAERPQAREGLRGGGGAGGGGVPPGGCCRAGSAAFLCELWGVAAPPEGFLK